MKLTGPMGAGYDPETKTLRIIGMKGTDRETAIDIEVADKDLFIGWLSSILYGFADDSTTGAGLVAHNIQVELAKNDRGEQAAVFLFESGQMRMQFVVPLATTDPSRRQSIQLHLSQALKEMGMDDAVQAH